MAAVSNTIILVLVFALLNGAYAAARLGSYNVDKSKISVSGISSGGYFAVQFHIAYSKTLMGAGVVAGGPYYCAEGQLNTALTSCMNRLLPSLMDVAKYVDKVHEDAKNGKIDDPTNLSNDLIYLYSGTKDTVVRPVVMKSLERFYGYLLNKNNIVTMFTTPSEHAFVTDDYGNLCSYLGSPFINNCRYPTAYNIFKQIYGSGILPANKSSAIEKNLLEFEQSEFFSTQMDNIGYIYVPTGCQSNATACRLHIAFHGCKQGREYIDTTFALHSGYSGLAEVNNIIVVFPQIHKSILSNPNGCWDWWGYTNSDYVNQDGPQMSGVKKILDRVANI
ncbi:PREDICTED: uncharacterized protein LOC100634387 [Amphimedon queenslandica]|uniref:Polyhydroxybutyrate depolymerase n=1 Tax=Amphimedon queenslandica TaxID=400682 RepID=A0A1X7VFJ9_AMPQE|nr:PREDICTED: uncharacterized protein LOC100634387 [Amphimedon queenslandica]|eukprot:XP_003384510.1 PREDICTED: uncharacterized protein LOC100634387 [Amphimedon queenslandica]